MQDGIYAKFTTPKGEILVQLEHEKTPGTVGNFVALAEGNLENAAKGQGTPYYDGLKFHRVIPEFMVQGGCPQGTGTGNPGYKFDDEFHPDLKHDKPGILAMANSGPATNGSQFFIMHQDASHLNGSYAAFGGVTSGIEVVDLIASQARDVRDKPYDDIVIESITVDTKGKVYAKPELYLNFTYKGKRDCINFNLLNLCIGKDNKKIKNKSRWDILLLKKYLISLGFVNTFFKKV